MHICFINFDCTYVPCFFFRLLTILHRKNDKQLSSLSSVSSSYYKYIYRMLQRLNLLFIIIQCIQLINFIDGYNNIKYSLKNNLCMSINKGNNYFIRFYYNFPYAV